MSYDIVYVLKQGVTSRELRYSLRSICENFDFNEVWFYGGCPRDIIPDHHVNYIQQGANKWIKTRSMFRDICLNDELTSNFWLFNDDFFIMQPYNQEIPITNGSMGKQILRIKERNGADSRYTQRLTKAAEILSRNGFDTLNYECHVPMLINRDKGIEVLHRFNEKSVFRSTYGNYWEIGGQVMPDYKIVDLKELPPPEAKIISTYDKSFNNGAVGEMIRNKFNKKCRYEL